MAIKFSQFTSTNDPTAIEKVVGYTSSGAVNFQIPTANLDTTYLITSPVNGGVAGQIDLTLTGDKAGVASSDVVAISSSGNITLSATAAGFNIDGGGGGVTTFTNTNDATKRVAYETVNSSQTGNVTIGDVDLSAAFWAGANNAILSASAATPVTADTIWFSDAGDSTIKRASISLLPADSLQATCNIGNTTTTVINASAGSASAPGYGINGDANTGMFSAISDTLGFTTGGAARLTIDATGNVGIGVTSPDVSLVINATDAVQLPKGTTANRNAISSPANGMLRYSTDTNGFEGYINNAWGSIGGGVTITKEQETGNGTITDFTLTTAAGCTVDNLAIYISGVYQNKLDASGAANFTVGAGANPTLQFVSGGTPTAPPVTATNGIEIVITR